MTKEEKQKQINNLTVAALDLCVKAAKVAIKPRSKYKRTNNRRMVKIMTISFQIAAIRNQIFIVRAIPRFKSGGIASVHPKGNEKIVLPNGGLKNLK